MISERSDDREVFRSGIAMQRLPVAHGIVSSTLCYLVLGDGHDVHVIDPGEDTDENWALLSGALRMLGRRPADVASIIVTHLHLDHIGMAGRLRRVSGAPIMLHRREQRAMDEHYGGDSDERLDRWHVPPERREELAAVIRERAARPRIDADRLLDDGGTIAVGSRTLRIVWTPGHTWGHVCLALDDERMLFTGDHLLPHLYAGLGLGGPDDDNALRAYLASLERVEGYDGWLACPGHGVLFDGIPARSRRTADHHRRRTAEIGLALDSLTRPSIWRLASRVRWSAGWDGLHGHALDSALAQTEMHVDYLGRNAELA